MKRTLLLTGAVAALAVPPAASADAVFHTQHLELRPVAGAPLTSGFVQQIHADGPIVYGNDHVVLNGARANASYLAVMFVFPFDPSCSSAPVAFQGIPVKTNPAGNGRGGGGIVPPELIPPEVRGFVHGFTWLVLDAGGSPAYATACAPLPTD